MPFTPKELNQRLTEINAQLLADWQIKIDKCLEESQGKFPISINSTNITPFLRESLIEIYSRYGWDLTFNYDQRDGNYLSIKPLKDFTWEYYNK